MSAGPDRARLAALGHSDTMHGDEVPCHPRVQILIYHDCLQCIWKRDLINLPVTPLAELCYQYTGLERT